jgi:hypothetical protein
MRDVSWPCWLADRSGRSRISSAAVAVTRRSAALAMQMPMSSCPGVNRGDACRGPAAWSARFVLAQPAALAVAVAMHYRAGVGGSRCRCRRGPVVLVPACAAAAVQRAGTSRRVDCEHQAVGAGGCRASRGCHRQFHKAPSMLSYLRLFLPYPQITQSVVDPGSPQPDSCQGCWHRGGLAGIVRRAATVAVVTDIWRTASGPGQRCGERLPRRQGPASR